MKSILCLLLMFGMSIYTISQPVWITFTDPNPSGPRITLQSSSNQQVTYIVEIPGMYVEFIIAGSDTFQRLSIPKTGVWGNYGYPELPSLEKLIAVPECDSIIVSYQVTDSIILDNLTVYPRPEIVYDSLLGTFIEQFTKNDSIYQLNRFLPEIDYEILSEDISGINVQPE